MYSHLHVFLLIVVSFTAVQYYEILLLDKDVELYLEEVSLILSMCQPNSFGIPVTLCLRRWSFRVSISSNFSTSEIQLSVYGLYDNYGINIVPSRLFRGKHNGSMF